MGTYSFLNVQAAIAGPGGAFTIGSSAGVGDEGITVEMVGEKDVMTISADGQPMHSLSASTASKVTVRLLKTSPINALLSALYNFQQTSAANWGQNVITVTDVVRGDFISLTQVAFLKQPRLNYGKEPGLNEWEFNCGITNYLLGTGVPDVNV